MRFHLPARPTGYKEAQESRQRKFPSMYLGYLISLKKIDEDQVVSSKAKLYYSSVFLKQGSTRFQVPKGNCAIQIQ